MIDNISLIGLIILGILLVIAGYQAGLVRALKKHEKRVRLTLEQQALRDDYREWPCEHCATGEMKHQSTHGEFMYYECDRCGDKITMP